MMVLDEFDKKILRELQNNNKISQRDLSDRINLSASAINRRIKDLEAAGIIEAHKATINAKKVGRPITIIVEITLKQEEAHILDHHRRIFMSIPGIQHVHYVAGNFDYLLILNLIDMEEYEALSHQYFLQDPNISKFQTTVVIKSFKANSDVLIE